MTTQQPPAARAIVPGPAGVPGKLIPYVRVSTDRQAEDGSVGPDVQLDAIKRWADEQGRTLIGRTHKTAAFDKGVSGKSELEHRPALFEAIAMLKARRASGLVVYRLDRLARDLVLQESLLRDIRALGADVFTTSASEAGYLADDPKDPARKLIRQVLGAVAEYERSMIALRLRSARDLKARKGGYAGFGSPPLGVHSVGGELVAHPDEQRVVERILEMRAEGLSLPAIGRQLQAEGFTSKRGGVFHPTTIARVLARHERPNG